MKALLIAICMLFSFTVMQAQDEYGGLTKKEYKKLMKEWKKRKKAMGPDEFKELVESSEKMKSQISGLNADLAVVQADLDKAKSDIKECSDANKRLKGELAEAKAKPKAVPGFAIGNPNEGIVFKVQIGAFKNKDLTKYIDNNPNFSGEDGDGTKKYTIGLFRDYWEADAFKKYMREMGVKDAWIVSYKDGARVDIKEVLEGAATATTE